MSITRVQPKKYTMASLYKLEEKPSVPTGDNSTLISGLLKKRINETPKKSARPATRTPVKSVRQYESVISAKPEMFCRVQKMDESIPIIMPAKGKFARPKSNVEEAEKIDADIRKANSQARATEAWEDIRKNDIHEMTGIVTAEHYEEALEYYNDTQKAYIIFAENNPSPPKEFMTSIFLLEMWFINVVKPIDVIEFEVWAKKELYKLRFRHSHHCNVFFRPYLRECEVQKDYFIPLKAHLYTLGIGVGALNSFGV